MFFYKYCADCQFLQVNDKGKGKYKCSKLKKDVLANMEACDKFEFSYRKKTDREKYYDMAKNIQEKYTGSSPGTLLLIAALLGLLLLICVIFF